MDLYLIIFQSIHCHLAGPLIGLWVHSSAIQHLNVGVVTEGRGEESGTCTCTHLNCLHSMYVQGKVEKHVGEWDPLKISVSR